MQVVAMRNIAIGRKSFRIGDELVDVDSKRVEALIRDGFATVVEPKTEFEMKVSELSEIEELDPEKTIAKRSSKK